MRPKDRPRSRIVALLALVLATSGAKPPTQPTRDPHRLATEPGGATSEIVYWVRPDGDDDATGGENDPFRTIEHAREVVRATIENGMSNDVRVRIGAGRYLFSNTLTFDARDAGRDSFEVIYSGVPGEPLPQLVGAHNLPAQWNSCYTLSGVDGETLTVWVMNIPPGIDFRTLYAEQGSEVDRLTRARTPNDTYLQVLSDVEGDPDSLEYSEGDLPPAFDLSRANLLGWFPRRPENPNFLPAGLYQIDSHDAFQRQLHLREINNLITLGNIYYLEGADRVPRCARRMGTGRRRRLG